MDKKQNKKQTKSMKKQVNVLESLKDIGDSSIDSFKKDVLKETSKEFISQLLGTRPQRRFSGEISAGESLEFDEFLTGRHQEEQKLRRQVALERRLRQEEEERNKRKSAELRVQLQAIMQEVASLAQTTKDLGEETKIAAMQAPVEPGVYHIVFFEKLLEFIKSFRKKIEDASVWLHATNKRAQKKNFWASYKKHGSKFLLAPDHYLTRSAG